MELTFYPIFLLINLMCIIIISYKIIKKIKSKKIKSWIIIFFGFISNFVYNMGYYLNYLFDFKITYPSFLDMFWILSFIFVGFGILTYWYSLQKKKKGKIEKIIIVFLILVVSITTISFIFESLNIVQSLIIDVLYNVSAIFALASCVLLIKYFIRKKLSQTWTYWFIGGILYLLGGILYYINELFSIPAIFEQLFYLIAFFLVLVGTIKLEII